jgi:hypothetical protein
MEVVWLEPFSENLGPAFTDVGLFLLFFFLSLFAILFYQNALYDMYVASGYSAPLTEEFT